MEHKINFLVSGDISQTIKITDEDYSINKIIEGLNSGKYITTIHEDKEIVVTISGRKIAEVINNDNNLEYTDFEIN